MRVNVKGLSSGLTILDETISMNGNQVFITQKIIFPSVGSYSLALYESKSPNTQTGSYTTKVVTTGSALSYINVNAVPTSSSAYENFELQCTMTDGCGAPVTDKTLTVSSTTLTLYGTLIQTTSTSSANFALYAIGTASITILTNVLKYVSISPSVNFI